MRIRTIWLRGVMMHVEREIPVALRRAYLALHRASDNEFTQYQVTADQFVLLATLRQGRSLTQRQLAQRMSSDPSTVRAMLILLENAGLVCRNCNPDDARAKLVSLTPAGKRKFKQLWKCGQQIRNKMYSVLQPQEVDTLVDLLERISGALQHDGGVAATSKSS